MAVHTWKQIVLLCVLIALLVIGFPSFGLSGTGSVGFVESAIHATLDGHELMPSSTLFRGDRIEVMNGVAVVAFRGGSRIVVGRNTTASFPAQAPQETMVALQRGLLSLYWALEKPSLRVLVGGLSIGSTGQFPTLGEITLRDGTIRVWTKGGHLQVEGYGSVFDVVPGETLVVQLRAGKGQVPGTAAHGAKIGPQLGAQRVLQILSVAATGASVGTSAVAMVWAGNAKDAANSANATAKDVITTANSVVNSSEQGTATSVAAGCLINTIAQGLGQVSPYTPPPGFTCP